MDSCLQWSWLYIYIYRRLSNVYIFNIFFDLTVFIVKWLKQSNKCSLSMSLLWYIMSQFCASKSFFSALIASSNLTRLYSVSLYGLLLCVFQQFCMFTVAHWVFIKFNMLILSLTLCISLLRSSTFGVGYCWLALSPNSCLLIWFQDWYSWCSPFWELHFFYAFL